jgi:hypothetical protein
MKVRAIKEGVLNDRVIGVGEEFDLDMAPAEWFGASGWLEPVDPGERIRRQSRTIFVNQQHPLHAKPLTLRQVQDELDDPPPPEAA